MTNTHELWAAAQLAPGEGIEDGVSRVKALLPPCHPVRGTLKTVYMVVYEINGVQKEAVFLKDSYERALIFASKHNGTVVEFNRNVNFKTERSAQ